MCKPKKWRNSSNRVPRCIADFEIAGQSTALVVIDMQNYIANPASCRWLSTYYPEAAEYYFRRLAELVIPNTKRLLTFFRDNQLRVAFVTSGAELPDGRDGHPLRRSSDSCRSPILPMSSCYEVGSNELNIIGELAPRREELVVRKVTSSAFNSTGIDRRLRNIGISTLLMTGVVSNGCVEATLRDAVDLGYQCAMVEDAVASFSLEMDEACFRVIDRLYGYVLTAGELITRLATEITSSEGDEAGGGTED